MKLQKYVNIYISIPGEHYDLAYGILYEYPTTGIEEKIDELIIAFNKDKWSEELKNSLIKELTDLDVSIKFTKEEIIEDRNWNEEFEKQTFVIRINDRIGIAPEWKQDELNTDIKILINPKMSFGTGEHATTNMMCKLMDKIVKKDSYWIDAGCGTGLLSILAVKLGARNVMAFDNDEWAVENTKENILINNTVNEIEVIREKVENINLPPADGIAANMFANILITTFPKFFTSLKKSNGDLIISGILKYDKERVIAEADKNMFQLIDDIIEDDWVALHFRIKEQSKLGE